MYMRAISTAYYIPTGRNATSDRSWLLTLHPHARAHVSWLGFWVSRAAMRAGMIATLVAAPLMAQQSDPPLIRLSISQAVELACDSALPVVVSGLEVDRARARLTQARSTLLPSLDGATGWTRQTAVPAAQGMALPGIPEKLGPFNVYEARAAVSQTLLDASSIYKIRSNQRSVSAAISEQATESAAAVQRAAIAYLTGSRAEASESARIADLELATELLEIAEAQLNAGVATALDVTRASTRVSVAQGALEFARNQRQHANVQISRALGMNPNTQFELTDALNDQFAESAAPINQTEAVVTALANRTELSALRMRLMAQRAVVASVRSEQLPTVAAFADYGGVGNDLDALTSRWRVGVKVKVSAFDGFRRQGRVQEHRLAMLAIEEGIEDLEEQVVGEVESSFIDLETSSVQQRIANDRFILASEEVTHARRRFQEGIASNLELVNAQISLVTARDAMIEAYAAMALARIRLAHAAGVIQTLR